MLSFKPTFSLSSFTFIQRLFSSSSLSVIRVVSSAYLRLLIFLPAILIPAYASYSPVFLIMYSAYKCGATQDGRVMVERSDRMWSTGKGNGKPLQYSCLENPMNSMKRQKDRTLNDELPRSVGAQHATGDQWRNNSRKNEGMEPKQKQHPVLDGTGDRSKF